MCQLELFNAEIYTDFEKSKEFKAITKPYQKEVFQIVKKAYETRSQKNYKQWIEELKKDLEPLQKEVDNKLVCAKMLRKTEIVNLDIEYLEKSFKLGENK